MSNTFLTRSGSCEISENLIRLTVDPNLPKFKLKYDEINYKNRILIITLLGLFLLLWLFSVKGLTGNTLFMIMLSVVYGFQFFQLYMYTTSMEIRRKDIVRVILRKSFLSFGTYFHIFYIDENGKKKNRIIMFRNTEEKEKAVKLFKESNILV